TTITDTTLTADRIYGGISPFLAGASLTLQGVDATTTAGGFAFSHGPAVIEDCHFTTAGPAEALQLSATSLTLTNTTFTSDHDSASNSPLLVLSDSIHPTISALTFEMAGQRGGISTSRGLTCEDCTFVSPGRQPAIAQIISGNLTLRDSTFTGLPGTPIHDTQHFITFGVAGILRVENST